MQFEIVTISSLHHNLSPLCMLKWPGQSCANHVQHTGCLSHAACHVPHGTKDSSAIKSDRVEIAFPIDLFHWLNPLTDDGGEETGKSSAKATC